MDKIKPIPPTRPYIPEEDIEWILSQTRESLTNGQLTLGPFNQQFEQEFAAKIGAHYAVAVNSGTSALEIVLRTLGIEGKKVIVPTNTFFATAAAVLHAGGGPHFADVDRETLCLGIRELKEALIPQAAGVILVHIGGMISPETEEIVDFCRKKGLFLIEDAAHSHGVSLNGRSAGTWGEAACFSFFPTKVMTSGEGGMIVTSDKRIVDEAKIYRDQGKFSTSQNHHVRLGYNWRMSEIHALIGLSQLRRLDSFIKQRRAIARIYDLDLSHLPGLRLQIMPKNVESSYYKYIAFLDPSLDRAKLKQHLKETFQISLGGEVYEKPLHQQPVFASYRNGVAFPQAEYASAHHICLPISAVMKEEEAKRVTQALRTSIGGGGIHK